GEANTTSPDQLHHFRLPEEFEAHTWCLHCWLGLVGRGRRMGSRWAEWILTDDLGRIVEAVAGGSAATVPRPGRSGIRCPTGPAPGVTVSPNW
ncbi:MAG TPA: hypothetical protein VHL54_11595, partial [Actinomycetota bacterium]|nr:hypothetical protein [Actinomycetota bacterium]